MSFTAGDFLVFQVESGFGLMRVLEIEQAEKGENIWHISAYEDLFFDVEFADSAIENYENLKIAIPHVALTNRAFESTQVSKMANKPLKESELAELENWKKDENREIIDRSIRLLLGLR
jgi:hypothetical protein